MFFRERSAQAEYFDLPNRPEAEETAAFRQLDRMNRCFRFTHVFERTIPDWLGPKCGRLEILDVGAGTGLLGRQLARWAERRGWDWRFTNLDQNARALEIGGSPRGVVGSALELPFAEGSFDLVVASQMTHHLNDEEVVTNWREARRVTRDALFISDLHRNPGFYAFIWLATRLLWVSREVREDSQVSVRRGFRLPEWQALADRAGIPDANIWLYYGTRMILQARKGALK